MTTAFQGLRISDGRVIEVVIQAGGALVRLQDWQHRLVVVTFDGVIAFEGVGAIDADLSYAHDSTEDPLIRKASGQGDESSEGYHCFSLISAWTDEPLLKIVARRAIVAEPQ